MKLSEIRATSSAEWAHQERSALLTMWQALAARQGRLPEIDWRSSLQAQHLNSVHALNAARQADDLPPWNRLPRLAAVLTPSGREYEMLWSE